MALFPHSGFSIAHANALSMPSMIPRVLASDCSESRCLQKPRIVLGGRGLRMSKAFGLRLFDITKIRSDVPNPLWRPYSPTHLSNGLGDVDKILENT